METVIGCVFFVFECQQVQKKHAWFECHIINYLLTELAQAVLGNIGPRSFLFARSVRTATTSGQYPPVRPSHSVSKRSIVRLTFRQPERKSSSESSE